MATKVNIPVELYSEATPNPEMMKFVANKMLLPNQQIEFLNSKDAMEAPFALDLFTFPYIKSVFIANNFITINKDTDADWLEIIPVLKEFIKNYLSEAKPLFTEKFAVKKQTASNGTDDEIVIKIKEILDKSVKPAVEMDGGAIQFKSFEEGKLTLSMQGACSGCPSSSVTLKAGIEGLMKQMIPEVKEVVADED